MKNKIKEKEIGIKIDKKVIGNMVKIKGEWIKVIKTVKEKIKQHNIEIHIYTQWTEIKVRLLVGIGCKKELAKINNKWEIKSIEKELKQLVQIETKFKQDKEWNKYLKEWNTYELKVQKSMYDEYGKAEKGGKAEVVELYKKWTKSYLLDWFLIGKDILNVEDEGKYRN